MVTKAIEQCTRLISDHLIVIMLCILGWGSNLFPILRNITNAVDITCGGYGCKSLFMLFWL